MENFSYFSIVAILKAMSKKTLLLLILAIGLIVATGRLLFGQQKSFLTTPQGSPKELTKEIEPSKTLKSYTDPSGFTFNYPDNLSLVNNEAKDTITYADIQLTAKGVSGSLDLKISDSKFVSLDEWVKKNALSQAPKERNLGNLKALEITTSDKMLLAALDQGVLFTIDIPFGEKKDFWVDVYSKVLADFSFVSLGGAGSTDEVVFEGEEVVE